MRNGLQKIRLMSEVDFADENKDKLESCKIKKK